MEKVFIEKVEIKNFRNISYSILEFTSEKSAISGVNKIGKTNSLLAISWLLTGALFEGKSDELIASIKPLSDTAQEVSVIGTLKIGDNKTVVLEKTFKENWVKTRGTTEVTMQGHQTSYSINGMNIGTQRDWESQIRELFGLDKLQSKTKVDIYRMFVDPSYIGKISTDNLWKELRAFIIELIGDVKDEDVFNKYPEFNNIKQILLNANGKTDIANANIRKNIEELKKSITTQEGRISAFNEIADPSKSELELAERQLERIDAKITTLSNGSSFENALHELESKIKDKKIEIAEREKIEFDSFKSRVQTSDPTLELKSQLQELYTALNSTRDAYQSVKAKHNDLNYTLNLNRTQIKSLEEQRENLTKEMNSLYDKKDNLQENEKLTTCYACGAKLSEEKIEEHIAQESSEIDASLERLRITKTSKKEPLDRLTRENEDIETNLVALEKEQQELHQKGLELKEQANALESKIAETSVEATKPTFSESITLLNLKGELVTLESEKEKVLLDHSQASQKVAEDVQALKDERSIYSKIINDHEYFERNQKNLVIEEKNLLNYQKDLANNEQQQMSLKAFMKAKLSMLNENVSKVFGFDIHFLLVKENIKADSFEEVCKPYIINKDTLWENGSTSEKIVTGIAIIEKIREHLGLGILPILFDEGESLDKATFTRLDTKAQVICAVVDNTFTTPTVVSIK